MEAYFVTLAAVLAAAGLAWVASVFAGKVSFVDSLWSLFFLLAAGIVALDSEPLSPRGWVLVVLVSIWAIRLSLHITVRNWGEPEDHRYQKIRENNEPGFVVKSLYIVFGLQGLLAWLIAAPLFPAVASTSPLGAIDVLALGLWTLGFVFEAVGDYQLMRFRSDPDNEGEVLDTGLWRYTRHPNYFGEFCIWWAFWLFALAAGGWWTIFSPLLISFLLLKVSGVVMLEKDIGTRRPRYRAYVESTNAFFPGPSHRNGHGREADAT